MSRIIDIIEAGGVLISSGYPSLEDVVGALADQLVLKGQLGAGLRDATVTAVCEREKLASTTMVDIGVSIPHARVDGVNGVAASLALSPEGVFHAASGVPISIVILVLSSPDLDGEHLNVLSGISMLLQSESIRGEIIRSERTEQVLQVIRSRSRK